MEDYERALCVRGFHVYCDVWEAATGEVLDCEREPGNAKVGMCLVFHSLSLELPSPLLPALLDSHERLLEVVLCTKVTLSGPVVRLYTADTAVEPFPPRAAVRLTVRHYFRGVGQPRKYFNSDNFPNYGI